MKKLTVLCIVLTSVIITYSQKRNTENVVIVTLDGMRWQEVFGGVDSALMNNHNYTRDSSGIALKFWAEDEKERRKKLFPFLWSSVVSDGQIYGNRNIGSNVNVANRYKFSYPGYNEIFEYPLSLDDASSDGDQ